MKLFKKLLSVPTIQKPRHLEQFGLDFSGGSLKALALEKVAGVVTIKDASYTRLNEGLVKLGVIENAGEVRKSVESFFEGRNLGNSAILGAPEVQNFLLNIVCGEEVSQAQCDDVVATAQKEIPFPLSETYYDYRYIQSEQEPTHVLFAAAPRVIVDDYLKIIRSFKYDVSVVEIGLLSNLRAVRNEIDRMTGEVLVVSVGVTLTSLAIYSRNMFHAITYLPFGSNHFDELVAKKLQLATREVEEGRIKDGFSSSHQAFSETLEKVAHAHIIKNIQKMITFYQGRNLSMGKFTQVVLFGGFSLTQGFDAYVTKELGAEAVMFDPFAINGIKIPESMKEIEDNKFVFTKAVGLALRATDPDYLTSDINLLRDHSAELRKPL